MQGWSESRQRVVAPRRGGREAQLARGGIREHEAFLGHELRGPAGTGRGGVSMAGGRAGQGARKGNGVRVHSLHRPLSSPFPAPPLMIHGAGCDDDDCFYYHSWRNNVVIAFGTLSSFLT